MTPSTMTASGLAALLSLSQAAASVSPIPVPKLDSGKLTITPASHPIKHRRLSSTGQTRRRLSEARDAASRPSPASLHSAASAFASLSLSTSTSPPVVPTSPTTSIAPRPAPIPIRSSPRTEVLAKSVPTLYEPDIDVDGEEDDERDKNKTVKGGKGSGKKRGTIFRCESCSKVYRHPSCLVKHRWEHSPHWREASKFLLSKHQQVQLLEAAAILSHLSPGTSLPEDRSLWPSYLSGGLLPPPTTSTPGNVNGTVVSHGQPPTSTSMEFTAHPISSSVPTNLSPLMTRARSASLSASISSAGPRMHDHRLPGGGNKGVTQIRPGLLAHPAGPGAPAATVITPQSAEPSPEDPGVANAAGRAITSPMAVPTGTYAYGEYQEVDPAGGAPAHPYTPSSLSHSLGTGGWSLPRSDVRSGSLSYSGSRSRSGSRSDEEESSDEIDADGDEGALERYRFGGYGFGSGARGRGAWRGDDDDMSVGFSVREEDESSSKKEEEEEWDGMDMDMEL